MKRIFTCEPGCDCVDWFVMIELGVVIYDQDVVVWTRWSHVNGWEVNVVVTYERGVVVWRRKSCMNCVRCDTYYFDLFIRNLERRIGKRILCRHIDLRSKHKNHYTILNTAFSAYLKVMQPLVSLTVEEYFTLKTSCRDNDSCLFTPTTSLKIAIIYQQFQVRKLLFSTSYALDRPVILSIWIKGNIIRITRQCTLVSLCPRFNFVIKNISSKECL